MASEPLTGKTFAGRRAVEVAGSISARYCGRVLRDLGAQVVSFHPGDARCESRAGPRFERYLDAGKTRLCAGGWDCAEADLRAAFGDAPPDVAVVGGTAVEVTGPARGLLASGVSVVTLTPFGHRAGPPDAAGGDVIAAQSGGYGMHLSVQGLGLSLAGAGALQSGPRFQASMYAGLCGAFAAVSLLFRAPSEPEWLDLSEQECVADVIYASMQRVRDGQQTWPESAAGHGASSVADGVVGMLPCRDGYVLTSPREDHQWRRLAVVAGRVDLGDDPRFADSKSRFANWRAAAAEIGAWSGRHSKQEVTELCQQAHVPAFALNDVDEARGFGSDALQRPWRAAAADGDFCGSLPFRFLRAAGVSGVPG